VRRLEITYKDGSSYNVSNKAKNATNTVFKAYIDSINPKRVKSAIIFNNSSQLVLIKDGIIINGLEDIKK